MSETRCKVQATGHTLHVAAGGGRLVNGLLLALVMCAIGYLLLSHDYSEMWGVFGRALGERTHARVQPPDY